MNPAGQPAPGQQQQQPKFPMYRPEQMRTLSVLNDQEKEKYEKGLRGLYEQMEKNGPETQAHQHAKQKIMEFSRMVAQKIATLRQRQHQQAAAAGQPMNAANNPALAAQRAAMAAQRPNQVAGGTAGGNAGNAGGAAPQPGQPPKVPDTIMTHVQQFTFYAPPAFGKEEQNRFIADVRTKYTRALMLMDNTTKKARQIDAMLKDREQRGQPFGGEELKKLLDQKQDSIRSHGEAQRFVESFRKQQEQFKALHQQAAGQQQQQRPQPSQGQVQNAGNSASMQAATASVNAAMDAAKNQQLAAANRTAGTPTAATPTTTAQGAPAGVATASTIPATSAPSSQPQHATAPPAQVKIEPGTSQPHPPPVNTAMAAAAATSQMQSAVTPTQNSARVQTPQTATPVAGAAKPLTHSAAMHMANTRQNSTSSVPLAGAAPTTTPGSAGMMGNASAQGSHPHGHPQQPATTVTTKMPIPKALPEKSTAIPTPVTMGGGVNGSRPTMGGGTGIPGNALAQPILQKPPAYTFEAEGEHVLSKKKLDELVRQVCGGGPAGQDGNYLTPDVEESVLNVADNFVDTVINSACRLAKERGSKVLEIRDIQLVLERVYNIRVPGYTSDELRTVRKAQPSAAWIAKMSAVQAAKVMPGKDDK
ncbi:Transcription initiation factor TFIID subunit 12 [Apiospora phragmitis]|uniref:Transcription initiation factor TFIID subunit 12 n=1 Tax=Apiospora phragmitis TaxID=2905665 RepID=A0ABR1TD09_9PEZI